ncbi:MAG: hypothetical protein EXS05_02405 [Planctomycetaceae bacterium]|nr:hypothetical protein [Planctomycetaceae bacterium]
MMPPWMHRGLRVSITLGCLLVSPLAAASRAADSTEPAGAARLDAEPTEPGGALHEVMQAGAKLLGKGTGGEPALKEALPAEPKGTSAATAKKAALAALPLEHLSPEHRKRVATLLKSASFYRRLPKVTFAIEPEVYDYFIAHPDVAVSIWRAMKISKLEMWQTGRYDYEADARDGSTGALEILHSGTEKHLVACNGEYKSPLFSKPIEAQSLMLLETSFFREADGTVYVTHRADLFVSFPSQTIDVVAKIFSPLTVVMTDRTFAEVSTFLKMMSLAMTRRPDWVEQIADKMEGIADVRKQQLRELTAQVHTAAQKRAMDRLAEQVRNATGFLTPAAIQPTATQPTATESTATESTATERVQPIGGAPLDTAPADGSGEKR